MIIQHNIPALNSYNKLNANNSNLAKNLEKLSSGYRINRAGDDAAGLAISEKMRAQITGLEVATKNAQDGVSLIQTAEGALQEVHSMLNRLVELSEQSANGIYQDGTDRKYIQMEVDELLSAIDQVSTTDFNGINLLNGTLGGMMAEGTSLTALSGMGVTSFKISGVASEVLNKLGGIKVTLDTNKTQADLSLDFAATVWGQTGGADNVNASWVATSITGSDEGGSITYELKMSATANATAADLALMEALKDATITVQHGDLTAGTVSAGNATSNTNVLAPNAAANSNGLRGGTINLQIGDKNIAAHRLGVTVKDMSSKGLGLNGLSVGTAQLALAAIDTVKSAIDLVNEQRDYLGAKQNRLEHTIANLETTTENLTDAESRIRDTDMAKEMMKYTKNSILVQSAQAMLAQANQLPSSVLNLLY